LTAAPASPGTGPNEPALDLLIIGAGIAGVVALYYARRTGFTVTLLEREAVIGGLWARLPPWQDIQFARHDWTLGDLPIAGEDQASIRANIQAWVDRYGLADSIRLETPVTRATRQDGLWIIETPQRTYRARHLICATGAHNRPVIPDPQRRAVELRELHSSGLREPRDLAGRAVVVVGGGASAYDLIDLAFEHAARRVVWVYRNTRWMMPTRKPKSLSGGPRALGKAQMEGFSAEQISRGLHDDMTARYARFGMQDILPDQRFDLRVHQLIPRRWRMIEHYAGIERHRAEVVRVDQRCVALSNGERVDADFLLWATGYSIDLGFFAHPALAQIERHDQLVAQCGSGTRALAEPGLYFMAAGLESTGTAPWACALMARTVMSHIQGTATLEAVPFPHKINHFDYARFLAARDPHNFPVATWEDDYRHLAVSHPEDLPLPIPD
jgi:Pyridine nucleotide-disulphide oxidoreductase